MADMWTGFAGAALGGLAQLGGGIFSAGGAAAANAANLAQSNMINQQMLNAQMAQHQQNTAFMEDAQHFNREERQFAEDFNAKQAELGRVFSSQQADKFFNLNAKFQEYMSNTAFQRSMADMRKAGLNPILAYMKGGAAPGGMAGGAGPAPTASVSGASSSAASAAGPPSLKTANIVNDREAIGRAIGNMVSSAVDTMKTYQGVEVMKADEKLKDEQTRRVGYETQQLDAQTGKTLADTNVSKQQEQNLQIENAILRANAVTAVQNARIATSDAAASERYGGKYAPGTFERIFRSIQDAVERGGPYGSAYDRTGIGFGHFNRNK